MPRISDMISATQTTTPTTPFEKVETPAALHAPVELPATDSVQLQSAAETPAQSTPENAPEHFEMCWKQLFEEIFSNNHIIYHSLKGELPRYENDTIYIEVKNNIQKENFESRKIALMEYWRSHFKLNVDDIEVVTNEKKETKKVIVSADDKMNNMMEQNPQLRDFLNVLNFRIKD